MTNMPLTQGVASLALGYALLGFQPVLITYYLLLRM